MENVQSLHNTISSLNQYSLQSTNSQCWEDTLKVKLSHLIDSFYTTIWESNVLSVCILDMNSN